MIVNKNGSIPVTADMIKNSSAIPQEMIDEHKAAAAAYKKKKEEWDALPLLTWEEHQRIPMDWTKRTPEQSYRAHKYENSEQWVIDLNKISMAQGAEQGTEYLIQINGDYLQLNFGGGSQVPNKYGSYISRDSHSQSLSNLYKALGKGNVSVERFNKGEGPTNAEVYETVSGKNFYDSMREHLKDSLKLYWETHSLESKISIKS
jgi:hypothetical protein